MHFWRAGEIPGTPSPAVRMAHEQGGMSHFTVLGDMFIKNQYVVLSYVLSYEKDVPQVGLGGRTDVPVVL
jgi:hypothetical protein